MPLSLSPPVFGLAPMAGMTDTAFRRLVKRRGGCNLVVTEMVSAEGLVRGIDRTLEYAEFTEEERPVSVQVFGGDPDKMAHAARIVQGLGADAVDVNMGCPVPKIAKHNAGCRLMREPDHAASIIAAMSKAVGIPVTVKMRAGWNEKELNAPALARALEDAGAAAISIHGRTAAQSYSGFSDWDLIARVAASVSIPVFGNGDLLEPEDVWRRLRESGVAGVLVGRGILRNPWLFAQAAALAAGKPVPEVSMQERGIFLLDYIDLLLRDPGQEPAGFRHRAEGRPVQRDVRDPLAPSPQPLAPGRDRLAPSPQPLAPRRSRERYVINKLRALSAWYTRGFENGSNLRHAVNRVESVPALRALISEFFQAGSTGSYPKREESSSMGVVPEA